MNRTKTIALLVAVWASAAVVAGARLNARGGVFGEAVGLGASIGSQFLYTLPWVLASAVAWWAAGRWPVIRSDLLRPITVHAWIGMGVVAAQQVLTTALSTLLPMGLRPFDPWARLPEHLTYRGPPALLVYLIVVASCLALRAGSGSAQDAPAAGRDESP
jgi:hypothetical protein